MDFHITNTSDYNTTDLKRIFARVLKQVSKYHGEFEFKTYRIKVTGTPRRFRGWAYLNSNVMTVRLGPSVTKENVAWLFEHEHMHNRGERHKDYTPRLMKWDHPANEGFYDYISDLELRRKTEKPKTPKKPWAQKNEDRARKALAKAEHDVTLAQARVTKWKTKVRYYDRKKENADV